MSRILQDSRWKVHLMGIVNRQGMNLLSEFEYEAPIRASLLQFTDDMAIRTRADVGQWIADQCSSKVQLRYDGNQFVIGFENQTDATLFQITYS